MSNYLKLSERLQLNKSNESKLNSIFLARSIHFFLSKENKTIGYNKFLFSLRQFTLLPLDSDGSVDFSLLPMNQSIQYKPILRLDHAIYKLGFTIATDEDYPIPFSYITSQIHWLLQTLRLMSVYNQNNLAAELEKINNEYNFKYKNSSTKITIS